MNAVALSLPFEDSRRLTGFNLYFADVGAVLETAGVDIDEALIDEWDARVRRMRSALGWPDAAIVARVHASGASLAIAAPLDQLLTATEVNEWALASTLFPASIRAPSAAGGGFDPKGRREVFHAPGHPAVWDEDSALHTLRAFSLAERNPALVALAHAARARGLTVLIDDDTISLGVGGGANIWPLASVPSLASLDWNALHEAPIALVTGSNGKTTTTRLLAAMLRAHGLRTAHTCTDGVFVGDIALAAGDYSGPAGARVALRAPDVEAAVLETARGGILRRGIAVQHSNVAVVTNVSDDHFGEYGIHDLDDLAVVKLGIAGTLGSDGVLVLNADDAQLVRHAGAVRVRQAWFAFDADTPLLQACRARGGATCGMRDGHLLLQFDGDEHDLGDVAAMPLTFDATARYNIANIAAAALAANALDVPVAAIAAVLAQFGTERSDNPGRLQHWSIGGVDVFVDYAHNPEGLRSLLDVATKVRTDRLGLLLGQAGNREDNEIRELAVVAAEFKPDLIVLKDIGGMLRGRSDGEIPALLREKLVQHATHVSAVVERLDEYEAVRDLLAWARPGDVIVLPIHGSVVKPKVEALLDDLQSRGWVAGTALPVA